MTMLMFTASISLCQVTANAQSGTSPLEPHITAAQSNPVASADWCAGHGVPESKCTKCNPSLIEQYKKAGDWCAGHGFPESVCPICNPAKPPDKSSRPSSFEQGTTVRFKSPGTAEAAGIAVTQAIEASLDGGVSCAARIAFNRNRLAEINARIPGVVHGVLVDVGQKVHQGEPLLVLESAQMGDYQSRLRAAEERTAAAQSNYEREKSLFGKRISSAREVEEARQDFETARAEIQSIQAALRMVGASSSNTEKASGGRYSITSPLDGTVVSRSAMVGKPVSEQDALITVADTSIMWAILNIKEWDLPLVKVGQRADVRVDSLPDAMLTGTISWIASEVDPQTRSVTARAEIENPQGLLKANLFAQAIIQVGASEETTLVPRDALQRINNQWIVFVKTGEGLYEPKEVTLGRSKDQLVQVLSGLRNGDPVVTTGAFLLKTEILKESIGAGCCEIDSPGREESAQQNI